MMEIISVSSKGQIVIPERIRKYLKISAGERLVMIEREGTLMLKKEEQVAKHIEENERKEEFGWMILAENALKDIWDNPKDDKIWTKYLSSKGI